MIKQIAKGDFEALHSWIISKKDKLYKICWSYLYNHSDIEDVLQNTMISTYENIKSIRKIDAFESWFISILLNECRKMLRERKRVIPQENIEIHEKYNDQYNFFEEINGIDEIYKEVVILKYVSGYSQEEIAKILDIPIGTVKSRIHRGLRDLRKLLKEDNYEVYRN